MAGALFCVRGPSLLRICYICDMSEPAIDPTAAAEEAWLNRLADEAEAEGTEGSVSLEEMTALLRVTRG